MSISRPKPGDRGSGGFAWLVAGIFIWIVAFPLYLLRRSQPPAGVAVAAQFCTKCGTSVLPGARFCGKCGAPLGA
jgi:hypothetical protein